MIAVRHSIKISLGLFWRMKCGVKYLVTTEAEWFEIFNRITIIVVMEMDDPLRLFTAVTP